MTKKFNSELVSALLYILVGVLLVIFQDRTVGWLMTAVGAVFILSGVLYLLKSNWALGAVSLIIGVCVLTLGWIITEIMILILGVLIAVKGIVALIDALRMYEKNLVDIVFAVLTIVVGVTLAFGNGLNILIIIAGVMLMFNGVLRLLGATNGK